MTAQYGHAGQHHGTGAPGCPRELHHHHDERCSSPIDDRRQRAREAYHDELGNGEIEIGADPVDVFAAAIEEAIETATRVRIDHDIVCAAYAGHLRHQTYDEVRRALTAAFRAAGFEVEQ